MKRLFISFFTILLFANCNSPKNKAEEQANQIQQAVNKNSPGSVPTSTGGFNMKVKMDGKEWVATSIETMDEEADRIIGYNNKENISLPYN